MDGLAEDEFFHFRPPKSVQEQDSLILQSKPKSTRYKDKWAVEVFQNLASSTRAKILYDLQRVQSRREVGGLG